MNRHAERGHGPRDHHHDRRGHEQLGERQSAANPRAIAPRQALPHRHDSRFLVRPAFHGAGGGMNATIRLRWAKG
jgi:hypothetical protein